MPDLDDITCFICGGREHPPYREHIFWTISAARREFEAEQRFELAGEREARYVAEYRPY